MNMRAASNSKKIILLFLLIIVLIAGGILVIDFTGTMFGVAFPLPGLKQIKRITIKKKMKQANDLYLLEREELSKQEERLGIIDEQLQIKEQELVLKDKEVLKKLESLKQKENELEKRALMLEDMENQYSNRQENIREQAEKLYNMPPNDAVSLLEQQEESDIVDILRAIDSYSNELGRNSTAPYLLKLLGDMNKEKAANVLRKLKYNAGEEDSAVDVLDEQDLAEVPQP
jgi:flagellar protein FlbB